MKKIVNLFYYGIAVGVIILVIGVGVVLFSTMRELEGFTRYLAYLAFFLAIVTIAWSIAIRFKEIKAEFIAETEAITDFFVNNLWSNFKEDVKLKKFWLLQGYEVSNFLKKVTGYILKFYLLLISLFLLKNADMSNEVIDALVMFSLFSCMLDIIIGVFQKNMRLVRGIFNFFLLSYTRFIFNESLSKESFSIVRIIENSRYLLFVSGGLMAISLIYMLVVEKQLNKKLRGEIVKHNGSFTNEFYVEGFEKYLKKTSVSMDVVTNEEKLMKYAVDEKPVVELISQDLESYEISFRLKYGTSKIKLFHMFPRLIEEVESFEKVERKLNNV